MQSWLQSFTALAAVALLTFAGGTPAPESSFGSTAVVQLEAEPVAVAEVAVPPLVVGPPPESLIVLASGGELFTQPVSQSKLTNTEIVEIYARNEKEISKIWLSLGEDGTMKDAVLQWVSQQKVAEPPPGLLPEKFTQPKPAPVPVKKAPQVMLTAPQQSYGSCGPGGCGVARRGMFGRRR